MMCENPVDERLSKYVLAKTNSTFSATGDG